MLGYAAAEYAKSLDEFGKPVELPSAGGWLLVRPFERHDVWDTIGCYPLFRCLNWQNLALDIEQLEPSIVSVALVTDPAASVDESVLKYCFKDVYYRYKEHYLADLSRPLGSFVSSHHQRNARRTANSLHVKRFTSPTDHIATWTGLYSNLVERHAIQGIAAFSATSFERQFTVPCRNLFSFADRQCSFAERESD